MTIIQIGFNGESCFNNFILSEVNSLVEKQGLSFYFKRTYQKDFEEIWLYLPDGASKQLINNIVICVEKIFSNMDELEVVDETRLIDSALLGIMTSDDRFTQIKVEESKVNLEFYFSDKIHQGIANLFSLQREGAFSVKDIAWRMTTLFHRVYTGKASSQLEDSAVNIWNEKNAQMKEFLQERAKMIVADYLPPALTLAVDESGVMSAFEMELTQIVGNLGQEAIFAIYEALNLLGFNAVESWYLLQIGFYGLDKEVA